MKFLKLIFVCITFFQLVNSKKLYKSLVSEHEMPYAVSDMTATTFQDDVFSDDNGPRIYINGGCVSNQLCDLTDPSAGLSGGLFCYCTEITDRCLYFTPETDTWFTCTSAPRKRYRHMAAKVGNMLYLVGGRDLSDNIITEIDAYNPLTDTWTTFYNWTDASSDGVAFGDGDELYVVGGYTTYYDTLDTLNVFNTNTFSLTQGASMNEGGRGDTQIVEYKNEYYVLGGWGSDFCNPLSTVEKYSVSSRNWTTVTDMKYGRGDLAAGVLGGFIFAIAGEKKEKGDDTCTVSVPVSNVGRYDQKYGHWYVEEELSTDLFRFVGASYNNSANNFAAIYLFGGQSGLDKDRLLYEVKNNTIKYIPFSVGGSSSNTLNDGGIAGIVIGSIIAFALVVFLIGAVIAYKRRGYSAMEDTDDNAHNEISSFDNDHPSRSTPNVPGTNNKSMELQGVEVI